MKCFVDLPVALWINHIEGLNPNNLYCMGYFTVHGIVIGSRRAGMNVCAVNKQLCLFMMGIHPAIAHINQLDKNGEEHREVNIALGDFMA